MSDKRRDRWQRSIRNSALKPTQKLVALELVFYMDIETVTGAHPGAELLAKRTSLNPGSVRRTLKELEVAGWIECVARGNSWRKRANFYSGRFPQGAEKAAAVVDPITWRSAIRASDLSEGARMELAYAASALVKGKAAYKVKQEHIDEAVEAGWLELPFVMILKTP